MPEQVFNPAYDVWVLPEDSGSNDNSGSTQINAQGLVDSLKSSDNEMRSSSWWNNFLNRIGNWFSGHSGWFTSKGYGLKDSSDSLAKDLIISAVNGAPGSFLSQSFLSDKGLPNSIDYEIDKTKTSDISYYPQFNSNQSEPDPTDPESWFNMLDSFYKRYQQDSLNNAQRVERFEQEEAQKLRDWQEYMSSTAYQRAIKDLREAGINPLLALSSFSPASTPSGAMASGQYSSLVNPGYSSLASSYSSILGQNKNLGSSLANILIRLLSLFMLA